MGKKLIYTMHVVIFNTCERIDEENVHGNESHAGGLFVDGSNAIYSRDI
jgi:hypothetical protein